MSAPFKYWRNEGSFDTAAECDSMRKSNINLMRQVEATVAVRDRHLSEQQKLAAADRDDKLPEGYSRKMGHFGMTSAMFAECIATDDPRLKEN